MLTRKDINVMFCNDCGHKTFEMIVGTGDYRCRHCLAQGRMKKEPFRTGFSKDCSLATLHYQAEPKYPSPALKMPDWVRKKWIKYVRKERQKQCLESI